MEPLTKSLEAGLTLEQIGALLQKHTSDILYISERRYPVSLDFPLCTSHNKLFNAGLVTNLTKQFFGAGQEYRLFTSNYNIPCWTLRKKRSTKPINGLLIERDTSNRFYTFFDNDVVDYLLEDEEVRETYR